MKDDLDSLAKLGEVMNANPPRQEFLERAARNAIQANRKKRKTNLVSTY